MCEVRLAYDSGATRVVDERGMTTTYQYNAAGNVVRVTQPDGSTIEPVWNTNNKITALKGRLGKRRLSRRTPCRMPASVSNAERAALRPEGRSAASSVLATIEEQNGQFTV